MYNALILVIMFAILVSLGSALFFLVRDRGKSERGVFALTVRVTLSIALLALLAWGLISRIVPPGG